MGTVMTNAILKGFYPDPSICSVGEDFYLVNSTFAYFPGVPIFHSRDLVNWTQIGNVIDRENQINLDGIEHSQGIYAPTIRYNNGTYYLITTNIPHDGNIILTQTRNVGGGYAADSLLNLTLGTDTEKIYDKVLEEKCNYVIIPKTSVNEDDPLTNYGFEVMHENIKYVLYKIDFEKVESEK